MDNIVENDIANPWGSSLDKLFEWDSEGAELLLRVGTNPWKSGILPQKEIELISLGLHCAATNLDEMGMRRHIRAALNAGATREELVLMLECGVVVALHSCSLAAPILIEEMQNAGIETAEKPKPDTPACDAIRNMGQWNTAWNPFYELSPGWTDDFFAFGNIIYKRGIFTPRFIELVSIAMDASVTHMYAPGTRRHIKGALKAGATPEEIMTVLQLCVSMGVQSCAKGIPILAEELEKRFCSVQTTLLFFILFLKTKIP
jgi:alkylhydroperoxidase/carboxymuconolactone decarboxylase family protein YurZ